MSERSLIVPHRGAETLVEVDGDGDGPAVLVLHGEFGDTDTTATLRCALSAVTGWRRWTAAASAAPEP